MGTKALNTIAERSGDAIKPQHLDPARVKGWFAGAASLDLQGQPVPKLSSIDKKASE
jgi:hypothetical protein